MANIMPSTKMCAGLTTCAHVGELTAAGVCSLLAVCLQAQCGALGLDAAAASGAAGRLALQEALAMAAGRGEVGPLGPGARVEGVGLDPPLRW
jgi:hypothetical protein